MKSKKNIGILLATVLTVNNMHFSSYAYTGWVHYTGQDFYRVTDKNTGEVYVNDDANGSFAYWYDDGYRLMNSYSPDGVYLGNLGYVPASTVNITDYVEFSDTEEGKKVAAEDAAQVADAEKQSKERQASSSGSGSSSGASSFGAIDTGRTDWPRSVVDTPVQSVYKGIPENNVEGQFDMAAAIKVFEYIQKHRMPYESKNSYSLEAYEWDDSLAEFAKKILSDRISLRYMRSAYGYDTTGKLDPSRIYTFQLLYYAMTENPVVIDGYTDVFVGSTTDELIENYVNSPYREDITHQRRDTKVKMGVAVINFRGLKVMVHVKSYEDCNDGDYNERTNKNYYWHKKNMGKGNYKYDRAYTIEELSSNYGMGIYFWESFMRGDYQRADLEANRYDGLLGMDPRLAF